MPNVSENTTDDVMVFFIEGDAGTTLADLQGTGPNTQGNWIAGTPYPIIDNASMTDPYQIKGWPTIYTICLDGTTLVSGQAPTETHYAHAVDCAIAALEYQANNTSASTLTGVETAPEFTFDLKSLAEGGTTEDLRLTLTSNAPDDWSASISSGADAGSSLEITVDGAADVPVVLNVTPGATAALVDYVVTIESLTNPNNIHISLTYSVIAGITDLVIDNGSVATQWNGDFVAGLQAAENDTHGVTTTEKFIQAMNANQLTEVDHLYYNIAWSFPSFTNESVAALSAFLDNGGNLFVSGQDIGWDTWDSSTAANGTAQTKSFYTDYLSTDYQGDGSGSNNQWISNTDDVLYGAVPTSTIIDLYNGNIYPDELTPIDPAVAIFHYNVLSKKGGIRVEEDGHKVVYLGIDLAMIADEAVRTQMMELTHDWFHGLISSTAFDEAFKKSVGQNYPNPTRQFTTIPFQDLQEDVELNVINALGQTVIREKITRGTTSYDLDLSRLNTGVYHCVLTNKKGATTVLPVEVIK